MLGEFIDKSCSLDMSPHLQVLTGYEFYGYVEEADIAVGKDKIG